MSGFWNRGLPLYREVSSFQGSVIEEFHYNIINESSAVYIPYNKSSWITDRSQ